MKKQKLTKTERAKLRKAAQLIDEGGEIWSCLAINGAYGWASRWEMAHELREKYAKFYGFSQTEKWGNLPSHSYNTKRTQLQRQLMLELFALVG